VLETLKARGDMFPYKNKWFWIFAKSGLAADLRAEASRDARVRLVALADMV
jgi:hypothetical protein